MDIITVIYSFSDLCTKMMLAIAYPELKITLPKNLTSIAAENGHLNILKWLINNGYKFHQDVCSFASLNGDLEMLKYARNSGCTWNKYVVLNAVKNNHLDILQWVHDKGSFQKVNDICVIAAEYGHLEIIKWAKSAGYRFNTFLCIAAAKKGHLDIVRWFMEVDGRHNPRYYKVASNRELRQLLKL